MALIDELISIANNKNLLATASPGVRNILYWCYGPFEIDLPRFESNAIGDMPTNEAVRGDLLRQESAVFLRVFEPRFNRDLDRVARIKIFKQTLARCTSNERLLLFEIVHDRRISGITRNDVVAVYGEQFFASIPTPAPPSPPVAPVKPKPGKRSYEPFRPLRELGYEF